MTDFTNDLYERLISQKRRLQDERSQRSKVVWAAVTEYQRQALRDELERIVRQREEAGLKPLSKAAYQREKKMIEEKLKKPEFIRPILAKANAAVSGQIPKPLWMFGSDFTRKGW
ncbi:MULTISPECIES: hypothetical protein [Aeromonas]|uniref:hypothetical protein n=1 Tax=Aeromonas TaxID=642 RepID=UPI00084AB26D|nr:MULTISPECIES: hypothetical protein [Aeromonas]MCS3790871.1 hypothetical protein [Aeromonas hydrophila]OEC55462.1 hypothetical protein A9G04_03465 [Aeromonas sp. ANNP30]OEC67044.1 hypothetical protein A9G49_03210 [Aeromonas sp. ANP5]